MIKEKIQNILLCSLAACICFLLFAVCYRIFVVMGEYYNEKYIGAAEMTDPMPVLVKFDGAMVDSAIYRKNKAEFNEKIKDGVDMEDREKVIKYINAEQEWRRKQGLDYKINLEKYNSNNNNNNLFEKVMEWASEYDYGRIPPEAISI